MHSKMDHCHDAELSPCARRLWYRPHCDLRAAMYVLTSMISKRYPKKRSPPQTKTQRTHTLSNYKSVFPSSPRLTSTREAPMLKTCSCRPNRRKFKADSRHRGKRTRGARRNCSPKTTPRGNGARAGRQHGEVGKREIKTPPRMICEVWVCMPCLMST